MGTRSLTFVYSDNTPVVCMYRQMDGYQSGHGLELAEFLEPIVMVDGLSFSETRKIANGAGCLAAQLVAHFKTEPGGIYLQPTDTTDADQDYEYHIYATFEPGPLRVKIVVGYKEVLYDGDVAGFLTFCKGDES